MTKPTLLIDGDQFLYRGCVAVEHEVKWDEENWVLFSNEEEAYKTVTASFENLKEKFSTDKVRIAFSEGVSFRKNLYPAYKTNRAEVRKPMCYFQVRDRLMADFPSLKVDGLEADDLLGIWATRDDGDYIIVSQDKDLKTIPNTRVYSGSGDEVVETTQESADYFWLYQTLIGDTADGYPGCPGIGPKKAEALLHIDGAVVPPSVAWERIVHAYEKQGLSEDDALVQARLARILRSSDWDATNKEVILWTPTSNS
ncbi:DNA polymerase-1 [Microvirga flocculans]|uniref:DNA polymerase-1 n=1 Tax=Microvirga flocculans TaxID=217168 RepID=A0A7W6ICV8_9HYPH|nr:hypothetical protein [Microvirga flocculans]MBB4039127.1 DNA polymerase-1 [Microvirga flocculans]